MWNTKKDDAFIITCSPTAITYSHLTRSHQSKKSLLLRAFLQETLEHAELEKLFVFNPTRFGTMIKVQYERMTNRKSPILIALYGPAVVSKIIATPVAHPPVRHFKLAQTPHTLWEYRYLYSHHNLHHFYVASMPHQLLLQFKLIAIEHNLPLKLMSTQDMALLNLYRYMAGKTFRHTVLEALLQSEHHCIEHLFSTHAAEDILSTSEHELPSYEHHRSLLASCGLFVSKGWQ